MGAQISHAATTFAKIAKLACPEAAGRDRLLSLPKNRTAKKTGIPVWPTVSKLLALDLSDSFRQNRKSASHFLLGFLLFGRMAGISLYQSATGKMSKIQAKGSFRPNAGIETST